MSAIQRSVFPFGSTISDAYNISTNGTAVFGDNSNNLLTVFTPVNYLSQFAVKGNINCIGANTDVSGVSTGTYYSNSVSATSIPADSSANRPLQKLTGYIRYNTDLSQNNIEYYNGSIPAPTWQQIMTTTYYLSVVSVSPTQQNFKTAGTTIYTPTSSSILYIKIRMVGGGGGGAGSGSSGFNNGTNGGATTFGSGPLFTANAGVGGVVNANFTSSASPGGIITGGYSGFLFQGGQGGAAAGGNNTGTQGGGQGGSSYFGGNGGSAGGSVTLSGGAGVAGGGGGGAGTFTTGTGSGFQTGAGGSAGGYIEVYLSSPTGTYSITVGAGGTAGTAGTSGAAGGAGGPGVIIIDEYYH